MWGQKLRTLTMFTHALNAPKMVDTCASLRLQLMTTTTISLLLGFLPQLSQTTRMMSSIFAHARQLHSPRAQVVWPRRMTMSSGGFSTPGTIIVSLAANIAESFTAVSVTAFW